MLTPKGRVQSPPAAVLQPALPQHFQCTHNQLFISFTEKCRGKTSLSWDQDRLLKMHQLRWMLLIRHRWRRDGAGGKALTWGDSGWQQGGCAGGDCLFSKELFYILIQQFRIRQKKNIFKNIGDGEKKKKRLLINFQKCLPVLSQYWGYISENFIANGYLKLCISTLSENHTQFSNKKGTVIISVCEYSAC